MGLTITAEQRDALYDQVLDRLSGIGDIEIAIDVEDYDRAERLGREFSDDLRLLLDDLGIGEGTGEPVELSSSPVVLRRVLPRLSELAEAHTSALDEEVAEVQGLKDRNRLVAEACKTVLRELDSAGGGQ